MGAAIKAVLIGLRAQGIADALTCFVGKFLRCGLSESFRVPVRRFAQKPDLIAIAPAPLAQKKVDTQADAFPQRELRILCEGLEARRFAATG
jgi:hypothetical protein